MAGQVFVIQRILDNGRRNTRPTLSCFPSRMWRSFRTAHPLKQFLEPFGGSRVIQAYDKVSLLHGVNHGLADWCHPLHQAVMDFPIC